MKKVLFTLMSFFLSFSCSQKKAKYIENGNAKINSINSTEKELPILIFDNREYNTKWQNDSNENFKNISTILVQNQIKGCGEFYYNEIERSTFIIACTRDGINFQYYIAYIAINKFYSVGSDMLTVNVLPK